MRQIKRCFHVRWRHGGPHIYRGFIDLHDTNGQIKSATVSVAGKRLAPGITPARSFEVFIQFFFDMD